MTNVDILSWAVAVLTVLVIPLAGLLIRIVIRQSKVEGQLAMVVQDFKDTTQEMQRTMREDRSSNNERLRWLERTLWSRGVEKP